MFVTLSVAAMLSMAAGAGDAMENASANFGTCITETTISHLGQKTGEDDFAAILKSVCQEEQKAFYDAIVAAEISDGASKKEAADYAREEVEMMLEDTVIQYAEYLETDTMPAQEG